MHNIRFKEEYEQYSVFIIPIICFIMIISCWIIEYGLDNPDLARIVAIGGIIIGSIQLVGETIYSVIKRDFALDYIAILAIIISIISQNYFVGLVIVLMMSGGKSLEKYAQTRAKSSLTALTERIPHEVVLWINGEEDGKKHIEEVKIGEIIFVRKGEVIALDGVLYSDSGHIDESSLTGEPYFLEKFKGDHLRSGTVNMGNAILVKVTKEDKESTYRQIIKMVQDAQEEKSPLIRLTAKYNWIFTLITLVIAGFAYFYYQDIHYVLAVLVIATPCPLILATPIALIGGMNSAAKEKIIVKRLASIEALAETNTLVFDKTGTVTLGKPVINEIRILDKKYNRTKILSISESIERNSIHPLAKSIVDTARKEKAPQVFAKNVDERLGSSISGEIGGVKYTLTKPDKDIAHALALVEGKKVIVEFIFEDALKPDTTQIMKKLKEKGMEILIFTGDKKAAADEMIGKIGEKIEVRAEMSPEDKKKGIENLKKEGKMIAMVGDGINDAPALALADVGLVFSHEEHTAASDAADIVFLGGSFKGVSNAINTAKRTIGIAKQSIYVGLGLSIGGMVFASMGYIPPVAGAVIQEVIDVAVIFNSLRASRK